MHTMNREQDIIEALRYSVTNRLPANICIMCTLATILNNSVGRGGVGRPDHNQQHCYHHAPTVETEAATAVV
jgi:hypothetical protein